MQAKSLRPLLHFHPQQGWINDPNGPCFFDTYYHLFFQHNPEAPRWGNIHWGHAISRDLNHWHELPPVLGPHPKLGMPFSGCVVFDSDNRSGLIDYADNPHGLVAIYTSALQSTPNYEETGGENVFIQSQSLAIWSSRRECFEIPHEEPVLSNPGLRDFRDPKVWREHEHWIMLLACGDHLRFYSSDNLHDWRLVSSFAPDSGQGLTPAEHLRRWGEIECPELIEFNDPSGTRSHILVFSRGPGEQSPYSRVHYVPGGFIDGSFTAHTPEVCLHADYGYDFYAPQSISYSPKEAYISTKQIWIGWAANWNYAHEPCARRWNGSMSLPRIIELNDSNPPSLRQSPIATFEKLARTPVAFTKLGQASVLELTHPAVYDITWRAVPAKVSDRAVAQQELLSIDRDNISLLKLNNGSTAAHSAGLLLEFVRTADGAVSRIDVAESDLETDGSVSCRLILDADICEFFIADGLYVCTLRLRTPRLADRVVLNTSDTEDPTACCFLPSLA